MRPSIYCDVNVRSWRRCWLIVQRSRNDDSEIFMECRDLCRVSGQSRVELHDVDGDITRCVRPHSPRKFFHESLGKRIFAIFRNHRRCDSDDWNTQIDLIKINQAPPPSWRFIGETISQLAKRYFGAVFERSGADFLYRRFDTKWLLATGSLRVISLDSN